MKKLSILIVAFLFTAGMAFAQNNDAEIVQNTNKSEADIEQVGSDNDADLTQQYGQYHDGNINQTGDDNYATLLQDNTSTLANISQVGSDNSADIYQRNYRFKFNDYSSRVDVVQNGDDNQAMVDSDGFGNNVSIQQGSSAYTSNLNNTAVTQEGSDNNASYSLTWGDSNIATIGQNGDNNYSEYSIKYGDSNTITADVLGDANRTRFNVNSPWGTTSSGNTVDVDKNGDGNYLSGKIQGSDNNVTVLQNGNNNRVGTSWYTTDGIDILGNLNTASVSQFSDSNSAFISVAGDGNTSTITQN